MSGAALLSALTVITITSCFLGRSNGDAECNEPPVIEKALAAPNQDKYSAGSTVEYTCEFGYIMSGYPRTITCVASEGIDIAEWTDTNFQCVPRSCGDPGTVSHARRNGSLFTFPSRVSYVCDEGYKLIGSPVRYCEANGQWSGQLPSCIKVQCPKPEDIENGRAAYESRDYGADLGYECDKGYQLEPPDLRRCLQNGTWQGPEPVCNEIRCQMLEPPKDGKMELIGSKPQVGSILLFSCDDKFVIHGSATLKCLSTGDWTVPPPECLPPCTIPNLEHGDIGTYERSSGSRRYRIFQKLARGTIVNDEKEVFLRCQRKYHPAGNPTSELAIRCTKGKWSHEIVCKAASCQSEPPPVVPNGSLKTTERDHGTVLTYLCDTYYEKTTVGNTKCEFGKWVGKQPVCTDTRCSWDALKFPGLMSRDEKKYKEGQVVIPECGQGYQLSKPLDASLQCVNRVWEGQLPPCRPASCKQEPPVPQNGVVRVSSRDHGSSATVVCDAGFVLAPNAELKCLFGEWKQSQEACSDTHCYLRDLIQNDGVDTQDPGPTPDGNYVDVVCLDGYERKYRRPKCVKGAWEYENIYSPCQPGECVVHYVPNGEFQYSKTRREYSYLRRRYEIQTDYIKINEGQRVPHEADLHIFCKSPRYYLGRPGQPRGGVKCLRTKWDPTPACLMKGETLPPPLSTSTVAPVRTTRTTVAAATTKITSIIITDATTAPASDLIVPLSLATSSSKEIEAASSTDTGDSRTSHVSNDAELPEKNSDYIDADDELVVPDADDESLSIVEDNENNTVSNCSCIFDQHDRKVIAHNGTNIVPFGAQIGEGHSVKFFCNQVGFDRLVGESEMVCKNCEWQPSKYPTCETPSYDDAVLNVISNNNSALSLSQSGIFLIPDGMNINISCMLYGLNAWADFANLPRNIPVANRYEDIWVSNTWIRTHYTELNITDIDSSYNGKYECVSKKGRPNFIEIRVPERMCSEIISNEEVIVSYSAGFRPHSEARFSCLNESSAPKGFEEAICTVKGVWSNSPPTCHYVECPVLSLNVNLTVTYTGARRLKSQARFECLKPNALIGKPMATCLTTGQWSAAVPSCRPVFCNIPDLMELLKEGVEPKEKEISGPKMPYGTVLNLQCSDSERYILVGVRNATCMASGSWLVEDTRCVQGCDPIALTDGTVLLEPIKETYRFGDFVTFSCPPGFVLESLTERLMCLQNGWSENPNPVCRSV